MVERFTEVQQQIVLSLKTPQQIMVEQSVTEMLKIVLLIKAMQNLEEQYIRAQR